MSKAILLFSGGIDSTTTLFWALDRGFEVIAITFNYEGRSRGELQATRRIVKATNVKYIEVSLPFLQTATDLIRKNPDAFKDVNVPEGYIPTRNFIFYALAAYYSEIYNVENIIAGHLKTDLIGFPDATPIFFRTVESLINSIQLSREIIVNRRILLPLLHMTKTEVVQMAIQLKVPLELTWSCYYDRSEPCENCESCWEREDAFDKAEIQDPSKNCTFSKATKSC